MNVKSYVFDGPPRDPDTPALKMTAKQYTPVISVEGDKEGLTLLFAHCIGAHKEQWEPTIEHLFHTQAAKDDAHRVREAWAFDWQNHGDSAVLNREALKERPEGVCEPTNETHASNGRLTTLTAAFEWCAAIASFINLPHMQGHRIVLVGHSAGAAAIALTTNFVPTFAHQYAALILVEPTMVTREVFASELEDRMSAMEFAVTATSARRDRWTSRAEALTYFVKRVPWGMWDERIVKILVEHGLEDDPAGNGVRLKCDRAQESVSYPDVDPHFEGAVHLARICHTVPIHLIWGTRNDLVPEFIQDSLSEAAEGRMAASVMKIEDAGHMVVQEQPNLLAQAIADIIDRIDSVATRSKL
ncbi:alpha/beta-hydrolase [Pholiota conissans]|uniref:Alpha/beta-hydrolase n=1 Tax=Pholiota conissans TaxID=109636 RepID=A0A9P5YVK8_9AGAR|nr:alpha/beta-hydrolase [Pholiota conissans]